MASPFFYYTKEALLMASIKLVLSVLCISIEPPKRENIKPPETPVLEPNVPKRNIGLALLI